MRGIERWGGGEIMVRTFTGFTALPGPDGPEPESAVVYWRDVLHYHGSQLPRPKGRGLQGVSCK
jgi:hypothetical protein